MDSKRSERKGALNLKFSSSPPCLPRPRCLHPPASFPPPSSPPPPLRSPPVASHIPPAFRLSAKSQLRHLFGPFLPLSLPGEPMPPSPPAVALLLCSPGAAAALALPSPTAASRCLPDTFGLTLMRLHVPSFRRSAAHSSFRPLPMFSSPPTHCSQLWTLSRVCGSTTVSKLIIVSEFGSCTALLSIQKTWKKSKFE
jgi:hypothetical protein